jgi:hypothetical protein
MDEAKAYPRGPWALMLLIAAGCGGGGSETAGIDRGGVRSPIAASGTISGFGSAIVSGIRYDSSGALVDVDGTPGAETQLAVGQVVSVRGRLEDGTPVAEELTLERVVVGPVAALDVDARELTVLGQRIRVDADTSFAADFSPRTVEGLSEGRWVAVSGFRNSAATVYAGRVEAAADTDARVLGRIAEVDVAAGHFRIAELTIDYGSAQLDGFPTGEPQSGDRVVVSGQDAGSDVPFAAETVERRARAPLADVPTPTAAVLEGFVTRFASTADFDVDGQPVRAGAATEYQNGSPADLEVDARLRLEGELGQDGVIAAASIRFRRAGVLRFEAPVEAVDSAAGELVVLGTVVGLRADTHVEDQSGSGLREFAIADLAVGDSVELRGYEDPPGSLEMTATRLEREDDDDDGVELTGFVRSIEEPEFFVLGIRIVTDAATEFDDMSSAEFFAEGSGRLVEIEGELIGGVLRAEEIEWSELGGDEDAD